MARSEDTIPPSRNGRRNPVMLDDATSNDYGAVTPCQIKTTAQLRSWVQKDAREVLWMLDGFRLAQAQLHENSQREKADLQRQIYRLEGVVGYLKNELIDRPPVPAVITPSYAVVVPPRPATDSPLPSASPVPSYRSDPSALSDPSDITVTTPKPPIFTDGLNPTFEHWVSKMRSHLVVIEEQIPSEAWRKSYVQGYIAGEAWGRILHRVREGTRWPFETAEDIFHYLQEIYGETNSKVPNARKFHSLEQGSRDFNSFWTEYHRLSLELDYTEAYFIEDLRSKLSSDIQEQLEGKYISDDLFEFADRCRRISRGLRESRRNRGAEEPAVQNTAGREGVPELNQAERTRLMKQGRCFRCTKRGHRSKECSQWALPKAEMTTEKSD